MNSSKVPDFHRLLDVTITIAAKCRPWSQMLGSGARTQDLAQMRHEREAHEDGADEPSASSATARNRDRDASRAAWHKGNGLGMEQRSWVILEMNYFIRLVLVGKSGVLLMISG